MQKVGRWLCWVLLMINVAYVVTGLYRFGPQHVDAYGIWLLKAKAIHNQTLDQVLHDPRYIYSHQTYPILLPWILSWGNWTLWLYPVLYGLVLFVLYRVLVQEGIDRQWALVWVTLASFMGPLQAQGGRLHVGLGDIWITLAVVVCMWATQKKRWWVVMVSIMLASMVKTEGIFLVAFLLVHKQWKWIISSVMPFVGWQLVTKWLQLPSDVVFGWPGIVGIFQRLGIVAMGVGKEMLNWRNWYIVWGIFWIQIAIYVICRGRPACLPKIGRTHGFAPTGWGSILLLMIWGYVAVYVFAKIDTVSYVASSADRIMLQLLPLWWVVMVKGENNCNKAIIRI